MELYKYDCELPIGLGMALAQNASAMKRFGRLSQKRQLEIIEKSRGAESKEEMQALVRELL